MFQPKISQHSEKYNELLIKYENGDESALDEILNIITPYIYQYVEPRYGKIDYNVINIIVKYGLLAKLKRQENKTNIRIVVKSIFSYTYARIEELKTEDFKNTDNLINKLSERLHATTRTSLAFKQHTYENLISRFNSGELSRKKFFEQIYTLTNKHVEEFIDEYCQIDILDDEEVQSLARCLLVEKINSAIEHNSFPKKFYHWNARIKRSINLVVSTEEKHQSEFYSKNIHLDDKQLEDIPSIEDTPEEIYFEEELKQVLLENISKLKPIDRQIIELRYIKNYTLQQIADVIGRTRQAVEEKEKTILQTLQRKMKRYSRSI